MRTGLLIVVAFLARTAGAQAPDTTHKVTGAVVSGVVHDSLAHAPLAGAIVELVAADNPGSFALTAVSDSLGRFTLNDVPDGRHVIGFFHPVLDSIGLETPLREVYVDRGKPVRADLAIPSARRVRAAICGNRSARDSSAVLVGIVRDAGNGAPAGGVTVVGEWVEISFRKRGLSRRVPHLVALTGDNGWFAMCNIPTAGTLSLIASRGADSTDLIEVRIPTGGFLRHELFLGPATNVVAAGSPDSLASRSRRMHTGTGILSGVVVAAMNGTPVAGAQVSITDGPQTIANDQGEWTLAGAPAGTRMLETRALGFYPNRRRVDIISEAAPVRVSLSTLKAVLDTVMITARRINPDPSGFKSRTRTGQGRYLTPEDIVRLQPLTVSDLFRSVPGLKVEFDSRALDKRIFMRGSAGPCQPAIYINGLPMTGQVADSVKSGVGVVTLTADDLDTWMRPNDVTGIEIYPGETAPIEYQQSMSGCGSILIWTKMKR